MTVVAPPVDAPGAAIDARIAAIQTLVNANKNPSVLYQLVQNLDQAQREAVNHYMVTGWLNAATIIATYTAPSWDRVGQAKLVRIAALQNLVNNPQVMPPGNANGYGGSGWTTILADSQQKLYAAQMDLVQYIMGLPGGTSAATMLANLTGFQTAPGGIPFNYKFNSVGFTDAWIDGV